MLSSCFCPQYGRKVFVDHLCAVCAFIDLKSSGSRDPQEQKFSRTILSKLCLNSYVKKKKKAMVLESLRIRHDKLISLNLHVGLLDLQIKRKIITHGYSIYIFVSLKYPVDFQGHGNTCVRRFWTI